MSSSYAYPPYTNITNLVLRWSIKGFEQTPPDDLDVFSIGKAISMTLRRSGELCVILRPEYGRYPNCGLQKLTIESPLSGEILDTYNFQKGSQGYDRISKEWKRYRVFYPIIEGLE